MSKPRTIVLRGILRDAQGRFLMMQRSRLGKGWPGHWEFPGGKVDPGEEISAALKREFREETGLKIELADFHVAFEWEREADCLVYLLYHVTSKGSKIMLSSEHDSWGWYSRDELKALDVSPPLKKIVEMLSGKE